MLSLLKIASAFSFVSRSCSSRSLLIGRPMRIVRDLAQRARPSRPIEDRALGRDQLALVAALEELVIRPDATDVGIAGSPALSRLGDLETRVNPSFRHAPSVTSGGDWHDGQLGFGVRRLDELDLDPGASRQAACRRKEAASFGHMNCDARGITACDDVDGSAKRAEGPADLGQVCLLGSVHASTLASGPKRHARSTRGERSRSAQVSSPASSSASRTR